LKEDARTENQKKQRQKRPGKNRLGQESQEGAIDKNVVARVMTKKRIQ